MTKTDEFRRGWSAVLAGMLGLALGLAGVNFYTSGLFVTSLQREFGWSRSELSAVSMGVTLTVVGMAPVAGILIDRLGVRIPVAISMTALALAFCTMGSMTGGLFGYATIQIVMAGLAVASTPIGFSRAVNERFANARGLALGLMLCGTGVAAAVAPPLVAHVIANDGWRAAYFRIAAAIICGMPLVLLLLGRRRPISTVIPAEDAACETVSAATYGDMLRDPRLRRLLATFFLLALGVSGFVLHMVPMLTDDGMSTADAASVQARFGIAIIVGRLGIGALVDYFFAPRVAALALTATIAGIVALAMFGPSVAPVSVLVIGFALGAEVDLIGYLTARYFGLRDYGRRYAILYGGFTLGSGASPLLIAVVVENAGGYAAASVTSAVCVAAAALLLVTAPPFPAGDAEIAEERLAN